MTNKLTPSEKRKIRVTQRRREARRQRLKEKVDNDLSKETNALEGLSGGLTLADLDEDQLRAYKGIHEWWDSQQSIGGTADPLVISGHSGCVDKDTEFMSKSGWKKISEYQEGDKVLQYDPQTDLSEMVTPLDYVKLPCEKMTHFYSQGVDQVLCDDHKFLYWTKGATLEKGGIPRTMKFSDLKERHKNSKGWSGKIKTTFKHQGEGIDFTEGELRLQVAVNADGRVVREGKDNYTQMRFSKKRKYDRLLDICKRFGLRYKDIGCRPADRYLNGKEYQVIVWPKTGNKQFTEEYYNATQGQLDIIADEVHHWDGSVIGDRLEYSSNHKCDADFIQYVYATQGFNTYIYADKRPHKYKTGVNYKVSASTLSGKGYRSLRGKGTKTPMEDFYPEDGYKYCFTVPSGFLILRRNMKIFTTGNCGKTTLMGLTIPTLRKHDETAIVVKSATYTGKAADVLKTKGVDADTIHYTFYNWYPDRGSLHSELKNRDELGADLIIIDEASMLPASLRKDIESLRVPIIYTGDSGQLAPVEKDEKDKDDNYNSNVMEDPHFSLTIVHRQALESGIVEVATNVRTKKRVPLGVYGVKKDMEKVSNKFVEDIEFLSSADVVICYSNRVRNELNYKLRESKGFSGNIPEVGEKLICVKNNREQQMFNGLVVYVESVFFEAGFLFFDLRDESGNKYNKIKAFPHYFREEYDSEGKLIQPPLIKGKMYANYFEYGYCISGHKMQGSSAEDVIVIEEPMSRSTLEDKRRWLYTSLTRASRKCYWVSKFK